MWTQNRPETPRRRVPFKKLWSLRSDALWARGVVKMLRSFMFVTTEMFLWAVTATVHLRPVWYGTAHWCEEMTPAAFLGAWERHQVRLCLCLVFLRAHVRSGLESEQVLGRMLGSWFTSNSGLELTFPWVIFIQINQICVDLEECLAVKPWQEKLLSQWSTVSSPFPSCVSGSTWLIPCLFGTFPTGHLKNCPPSGCFLSLATCQSFHVDAEAFD